MQGIADEVGVHRSTLYRRWPTEQALLALALERTASQLAEELDPTSAPLGELLARLVVLLDSRSGRGLVRAQVVLGTTLARSGTPHGTHRGDQDRAAMLDLLVGAVIHRLFVVGEPCDAAWQQRVLHQLGAGERSGSVGVFRQPHPGETPAGTS